MCTVLKHTRGLTLSTPVVYTIKRDKNDVDIETVLL